MSHVANMPAPQSLDHPLISNGNRSLIERLPNKLLKQRLEQLGNIFTCHCLQETAAAPVPPPFAEMTSAAVQKVTHKQTPPYVFRVAAMPRPYQTCQNDRNRLLQCSHAFADVAACSLYERLVQTTAQLRCTVKAR
jgi:hypothetical protein